MWKGLEGFYFQNIGQDSKWVASEEDIEELFDWWGLEMNDFQVKAMLKIMNNWHYDAESVIKWA